MSERNVVRRNPKNGQRKNTDGYRTDSGCFEDVDLQMANQNFLTRASSEPIVEYNDTIQNDVSLEEQQDTTGNGEGSPIPPSLADECADDKDFHAILKRLSDITTNPGELYRLCFSSRLSYCGHMPGIAENEGSFRCTDDIKPNGINALEHANCDISEKSGLEGSDQNTKSLSHKQQCAELLSLLSSCANKANENPSMFTDSSLGNSLVAQLSSLLSTLEKSKSDDQQLNEQGQSITANRQILHDSSLPQSAHGQLPARGSTVLSTLNKSKYQTPPSPHDSNGMDLSSKDTNHTQAALRLSNKLNNDDPFPQIDQFDVDIHQGHFLPSNSKDELESELLPSPGFGTLTDCTHFTNDNAVCDASLNDSLETHSKIPTELEELETPLIISSSKTSYATSRLHSELHDKNATSNHSSSFPTTRKTELDDINSPSTNKDESQSLLSNVKHTDGTSEVDVVDGLSSNSSSSVTDGGDVVTNGRRAVKPYSWDYGDIWEKELERAESSELFRHNGKEGQSKDPVRDMFQSFEEIRDDLFYNAGFVYENGRRSDGVKRRSRSADARPNLQGNTVWPEYYTRQSDVHSPFVRTVYQDEQRQSSGMRRSWSSQHIAGTSVMVNVDWTNGRQMRVITAPAGQGFDDVRAQIIKEAVVKTSTFRGAKPWSVLKRRPSGLRRRPGRNEFCRSKKNEELRVKIEQDSESSDSPYVSASSSDCLTTTTDDSSSVTSLQYYASSSLPSSPSVSNRSSACFSDTGASDASNIRRVVFQKTTSSSAPRELCSPRFRSSTTHRMTLDQRFGFIQSHDRLSSNGGLEDTSFNSLNGLQFNPDHNNNSDNLRRHSSTLPRKFHGNHLVSPLLIRSNPDLNCLTKVQFVGDSYSRSRISKNLRHTRNRSQSPSPMGQRSAHTRVVSCEIVQSDNKKRDVYTKVNISESFDNEEEKTNSDSRKTKLGQLSTRRSWHGQSPLRVHPRQNLTNTVTTQGKRLPRYSLPSRFAQQHQQGLQLEKPLHATLISIKNHQSRMHTHWSTGSLRQPVSEKPRLLLDCAVTTRPRRLSSMKSDGHPLSWQTNVNVSSMRNSGTAQVPGVLINSERRRSPPDYLTAARQSKVLKRQSNPAQFIKTEKHLTNSGKAFSSDRHSPTERKRLQNKPRTTMQPHCVEETSFVGSSNFSKSQIPSDTYRTSSEPSFVRTRLSRSLNEKDTISRRKLHDSDIYRRRAMEINQSGHNDSDYMMYSSRCGSDGTTTHRSERRRRYSDGGANPPDRHNVSSSDSIVQVSRDPHRESTCEGTHLVAKAESVTSEGKSNITSPACQSEGDSCAPFTHSDEMTALQTSGTVNNKTSHEFDQPRTAQSTRQSKERTHPRHTETAHRQITDSKCNSTVLLNTRSDVPPGNDICTDCSEPQNCTTVPLKPRKADEETSSAILAHKFPFDKDTDNNKIAVSALPVSPPQKRVEQERKFISTAELQLKSENRSDTSKSLPYARTDKASTTIFNEDILPYKQVNEVGRCNLSRSHYARTGDENSNISTNSCVTSSVKMNSVQLGEDVSNHTEEETKVILSPVLPNRKTRDKSSEVSVFIDYRNKRPVSVEYSKEDVSLLKTLGTVARKSRKGKHRGSREFRVKTGRNNTSCTISDGDVSSPVKQDVTNEGVCHSRLSRKDKHEREVLTSKVPSARKDLQRVMEASHHRPSPEPYRRDSTIIYTDARASYGSDTDSISRDSTISSSGSDRTVILQEHMDVSVDDLEQLSKSGSKIGIEIAPIDMGTGDETFGDTIVTDEMPPAMKLSNTFENCQKRISGNIKVNPELLMRTEPCNFHENASSPENSGKNNTLKRHINAKNDQNLSSDKLTPSSGSVQSSCSSIASSRTTCKSMGTESAKGKLSPKNGGKGFFSRLKNIRNSLRVKKSDSISFEKREKRPKDSKGDIQKSGAFYDENDDVLQQLTSSTDANANVLSMPRNRTMSHTRGMNTPTTQSVIARRSYDAFRHPSNSFRNVVGEKSMSSDQLNAYRINNTLHIDEATAKSLEVLVETCI